MSVEKRKLNDSEEDSGQASSVLYNPDDGACVFCCDPLKAGEGIMLLECKFMHLFCKNCLQGAIEMQKEVAQILCPVADDENPCGGIIRDSEVKEVLSAQAYQEYINRSLVIAKKKMKNVFVCKTSNCGGWCEFIEGRKTFICPCCSETNCMECDTIHGGISCETYRNLINTGEHSKLKELLEQEKKSGWSQLLESLNETSARDQVVENGFIKKNLVPNYKTFECPICFNEIEKGDGTILQECLHTFCKECLIHHVKNSEDARVKCPYMDDNFTCTCYLQDCEIKELTPPDIYEKYLQRSINLGENTIENTYHCRLPNCPGWWEVLKGNGSMFDCPICNKPNCIKCDAIHEGTCEDYQNTIKQSKNDQLSLKALEKLIKNGSVMRCPKCKIPIHKTMGCDWVLCSACRTEICWATRGPRWGPKGYGDTSGGCRCRVNGKRCSPKCRGCH